MKEHVHVKGMPDDTKCEVHAWPDEGLGARLVKAMRERHGKGGINVCAECVERARDAASTPVAVVSKKQKMRELEAAGWTRHVPRPKEPTYWNDPLGLLGERPRTEQAYEILCRRRAHGVGR